MVTDTLGWHTLALSWIEKCNLKWTADYKQIILELLNWIFPPVNRIHLHFIRQFKNYNFEFGWQMLTFAMAECKYMLSPLECNLATTTFNIFQMVMDEAIEANADDYQKFLMSWFQAAAIYSVVWGIGGMLDEPSRDAFDRFHRRVSFFAFEYDQLYQSLTFCSCLHRFGRVPMNIHHRSISKIVWT